MFDCFERPYLQANRDLVSGLRKGHAGPGPVSIRATGVFLGGFEHDCRRRWCGPSVLFGDCEIAEGARVVRSVLGAGSVIEAGATVVDSVLMEGEPRGSQR